MRVVAAFCLTCEKIDSVQRRFTKRFIMLQQSSVPWASG